MINRKRGKEPVFHLRLHKSKQQAILLCSQENVPLLSHFVLCKIDWIFLQIRLVFKSQCVSGPSSFTQVVQVGCRQHPSFLSLALWGNGCRQHPSFLSLALWGNRLAPPFPLSFASLLSANSFSSTLTCVDLRMTGQSSSPRGEEKRVREWEREREREWRNLALTDLTQGVAGRYIACRVQRIIAAVISAHGYCRTHTNTCPITL